MPSPTYVVAVVDDDDLIREALQALLPAFDCTVELYDSACALLAAIAATRANCMMIDVHLGETSGFALGRRLAQIGINLPVIYMSGSCGEDIRVRAHDAGGVAFLRKPFLPAELAHALDAARRRGPRYPSSRGE